MATPLHRTLEECEALLRHAQETAAELRQQAGREAVRAHRDADEQVSQRIHHAAEVADRVLHDAACRAAEIIQDAQARRVDVERRMSELRRSSEEMARRTILESEQAAADRRGQAEKDALAMLALAWRQSVTLQQDLLDELEAEADDVLRRAEADAALLRSGAERVHAEARRLREEAAHIRRDACRYADDLFTAALHAVPEPDIDGSDATRPFGADVVSAAHVDIDHQTVRGSLVILVLALFGGIAVYLADGLIVAPALPAAALLALGAVVLAHRRPRNLGQRRAGGRGALTTGRRVSPLTSSTT